MEPFEYWQNNIDLVHITPPDDRYPEIGLEEALKRACNGTVCEFGCGDGRLSGIFDPDKYFGYDINKYALAAAKESNPEHKYRNILSSADTILAYTVLLHIPDHEIEGVIDQFQYYDTIVIGEIMGRKWRRSGNPPVFNRELSEYIEMIGRDYEVIKVPYPRYKTDLELLVCSR